MMLTNREFAEQDFFEKVDSISRYDKVKSNLILGSPRPSFVSVAIPTFGRVHLLKQAIESLQDQTDQDFTIIITDNDPEENNETQRYLQDLNDDKIIYYRNEENIGALANFNRCISMADGIYVIMLCTDDLLSVSYIENLKMILSSENEVDMLLPEKDIIYNGIRTKMKGYSSLLRKIKRLTKRESLIKLNLKDFIMYYPAGGPSGIAYLKEFFLESGGFNPEWHPTGDYMLHAKMAHQGNVYLSTVDSGDYRLIESITLEDDLRSIYMVLKYLFLKFLIREIHCF